MAAGREQKLLGAEQNSFFNTWGPFLCFFVGRLKTEAILALPLSRQ